jgi:tRNA uridine 5-carboxymethylaminomethyl modification enzyme
MFEFDIIVCGAGHAGCEAALVSARCGKSTLLLNLNLDTVAWTPCNPSVGGPAKGIVAREIDALGGEIAKNTDASMINIRMLNTSKGYAVQAVRAQIDKYRYSRHMAHTLYQTPNLVLRYGLAEKLLVENGSVTGIETRFGEIYRSKAVIITAGTFLKGKIFVGPHELPAGRLGELPSDRLSESIEALGIKKGRFKTGTPARILRNSIEFSVLERQDTSQEPLCFSYFSDPVVLDSNNPVFITRTNNKTHQIIRENLHFSPLYGDVKLIGGIGPRYCPSIEDKVMKFTDRDSHQIFVEPEGNNSDEYYLGGFSTSLPFEAQVRMVQSLTGMEHAKIARPAYAIEYDYFYPEQLRPTLETKACENLYFAGQINGTSGYEEAAGQGYVAAINAVRKLDGKSPWVPKRTESYIGVMIDDLVTKGVDEPYRLLTSRAEYRLLLRNDNAHLRLTKYGYEFGLIEEPFFRRVQKIQESVQYELERLATVLCKPSELINQRLTNNNTTPITNPIRLIELLKRPQVDYADLREYDPVPIRDPEILEQIRIELQYHGYIQRALNEIKKMEELDTIAIPPETNYANVPNLATEARQKLNRIKPDSIGQAMRIPGINPTDIANLVFFLRNRK